MELSLFIYIAVLICGVYLIIYVSLLVRLLSPMFLVFVLVVDIWLLVSLLLE